MQKLFTAVKYLTIWRNFAAVQASPAALGASMIYFPVIGLALGLFLALINYLLAPYLAPEILSMDAIVFRGLFIQGDRHQVEGWLRQRF